VSIKACWLKDAPVDFDAMTEASGFSKSEFTRLSGEDEQVGGGSQLGWGWPSWWLRCSVGRLRPLPRVRMLGSPALGLAGRRSPLRAALLRKGRQPGPAGLPKGSARFQCRGRGPRCCWPGRCS
jgi:hypothetical protein